MKIIRTFIVIFIMTQLQSSSAQAGVLAEQNKTYQILGKLISIGSGHRIFFAKFMVLKNFNDSLELNDTIYVGFHDSKPPAKELDYVLLTVQRDHNHGHPDYFICPRYDGFASMRKARVEFIDLDYWEKCEMGTEECKPINYTREVSEKNWFLIMPCGGTETLVAISGPNFKKEIHLFHKNCPPCLELTNLTDGQYTANMSACGLGGRITFNVTTK